MLNQLYSQVLFFIFFTKKIINLITIYFTILVDEKDEMSISDVAHQIANSFKFGGKIQFDTTQSDGQFKKTASNAKLRQFLPNFKFTPFNIAIQDTVNWYKDNIDKIRK